MCWAVCFDHALRPTGRWQGEYESAVLAIAGRRVEYTCAGRGVLSSAIRGVSVGVWV